MTAAAQPTTTGEHGLAVAAAAHTGAGDTHPSPHDAPIVLVLTVDLGNGDIASLSLRDGDDPDAVALKFVREQGLPFPVVGPLAQRLREALATSAGSAVPTAASARAGLLTAQRPHSSAGGSSGERMYRAALEAQQRKERLAATEKLRREEAALADCQPGPVITSRARRLQRQEPAWKRLNALASHSIAAREQLSHHVRAAEEEAELAECTFAPITTSKSALLMAQRQAAMREAGVTAHDTLYADAQRRAARDAELRSWMPQEATFRPAVLPTAHVPPGAPGDVVQRLHLAGQVAKQHQGAAAEQARRVDPSTGLPLFVPQTGRRGPANREVGGATHAAGNGDTSTARALHLYALRDEYTRRKQQLAAKIAAQEDVHRAGASQRSAALAESRRMRRFAQIFRALDTKRQGAINPWDAAADALARLHPEIAADVQLAASLSGPSDLVDEDAFCALMEAAVRLSHTGPRGYLGASTAGRSHTESAATTTFKPRISQTSRALAARRRPADVPVHEVLAQEQQRTQEKLRHLQTEVELSNMAECTFRPSTAPFRGSRSSLNAAAAPVTLSHVARLPPVPHAAHPDTNESKARFAKNLELLDLSELSLRASVAPSGVDEGASSF